MALKASPFPAGQVNPYVGHSSSANDKKQHRSMIDRSMNIKSRLKIFEGVLKLFVWFLKVFECFLKIFECFLKKNVLKVF